MVIFNSSYQITVYVELLVEFLFLKHQRMRMRRRKRGKEEGEGEEEDHLCLRNCILRSNWVCEKCYAFSNPLAINHIDKASYSQGLLSESSVHAQPPGPLVHNKY